MDRARDTERHLDSQGKAKSVETRSLGDSGSLWRTASPHLRAQRKSATPDEQRKQQQKLDQAAAKLDRETPDQRQRLLQEFEKNREKDREFLREIPELYDFRLEGDAKVDGYDAWVIAATPKPDYKPKLRDAKPLLKIKGKLWVDKTDYQWVRLEAETTDTISFGLFLARLNPGAKLVFEQTRVNNEVWLPKREFTSGTGRLGLVKKIAMEQELTWSNYRKFQVDSRVVSEK